MYQQPPVTPPPPPSSGPDLTMDNLQTSKFKIDLKTMIYIGSLLVSGITMYFTFMSELDSRFASLEDQDNTLVVDIDKRLTSLETTIDKRVTELENKFTPFGNVRELTDENFEKAIKRGVVVIEYYAGWNKANMVTILDEWDNFEVSRVFRLDVEKYDKIMTSQKVVVLPTIIFYLDGEEADRLQGNMKFQLETTIKELDRMVEELRGSKFN
jgi:hypothetical protein